MRIYKLFEDELSQQLRKQVFEVSNYINQELDKRIVKQLLMRVLERKLYPVLLYSEKREEGMMPMWCSSGNYVIDVHTPVPELKLYDSAEYISDFGVTPEEFTELIKSMLKIVVETYD